MTPPRSLVLTPTTSRVSRWGWPAGEVSLDDAVQVMTAGKGPVYVLGIDQAGTSGLAAADPLASRIVALGETRSTNDQVAQLEALRELPGFDWAHVLVVFEDHGTIDPSYRQAYDPKTGERPSRNPRVPIGLGDARGGWRVLLDLRNHPASQRLLAPPSEWRRVYKGARLPGDSDKDTCLRWASAQVGARLTSDDVADAVGLSVWGSVDGLQRWASNRLRKRAADRARGATRARTSEGDGS